MPALPEPGTLFLWSWASSVDNIQVYRVRDQRNAVCVIDTLPNTDFLNTRHDEMATRSVILEPCPCPKHEEPMVHLNQVLSVWNQYADRRATARR